MKYKSLLKLLTLGFSFALILASCTKEGPMGPAGADGTNGTNGTDGTNGVDGIAFCLECHTSGTIDGLTAQWAGSGHAIGSSLARGTTSGCSRCHSGVGFSAYLAGSEDLSGSAIGCSACHSHGEPPVFQDGDGNAVFISTVDAVKLMTNASVIIDMESNSNLCVNCHQPMTGIPTDNGEGMFTVTSTHWGPHHGPQSVVLEGLGGVEFPGSETYPGTKSHAHRKSAGCVKCHMEESNHNFATPEVTACATCHGEIDDFDVNGKLSEIHLLVEELSEILTEKGLLLDGHPNPGTYKIDEASALYNLLLIEEDKSEGVHNPPYTVALLTNSIEAMQAETASN